MSDRTIRQVLGELVHIEVMKAIGYATADYADKNIDQALAEISEILEREKKPCRYHPEPARDWEPQDRTLGLECGGEYSCADWSKGFNAAIDHVRKLCK